MTADKHICQAVLQSLREMDLPGGSATAVNHLTFISGACTDQTDPGYRYCIGVSTQLSLQHYRPRASQSIGSFSARNQMAAEGRDYVAILHSFIPTCSAWCCGHTGELRWRSILPWSVSCPGYHTYSIDPHGQRLQSNSRLRLLSSGV